MERDVIVKLQKKQQVHAPILPACMHAPTYFFVQDPFVVYVQMMQHARRILQVKTSKVDCSPDTTRNKYAVVVPEIDALRRIPIIAFDMRDPDIAWFSAFSLANAQKLR